MGHPERLVLPQSGQLRPRELYRFPFGAPKPVFLSPTSTVHPATELNTSGESSGQSDLSSLGCTPLPVSPSVSCEQPAGLTLRPVRLPLRLLANPPLQQQPATLQPQTQTPSAALPVRVRRLPVAPRCVQPGTSSVQQRPTQTTMMFDNEQERWNIYLVHFSLELAGGKWLLKPWVAS
jgi:hypothetical protein